MAESAVAHLRALLADRMRRAEIEQLIGDVAEEVAGRHLVGDTGQTCRAIAFVQAADLLDSLHGDNAHLAREWDWWDAATIPGSCATLLRSIVGAPDAEHPIPYQLTGREERLEQIEQIVLPEDDGNPFAWRELPERGACCAHVRAAHRDGAGPCRYCACSHFVTN